jgi:hypothetical protein
LSGFEKLQSKFCWRVFALEVSGCWDVAFALCVGVYERKSGVGERFLVLVNPVEKCLDFWCGVVFVDCQGR